MAKINEKKLEYTAKCYPMLVNKPHAKGEMQAKLVSLSKLILFWDPSRLQKRRSQLHINGTDFNQVIRVYDVSQIDFNGENAHRFDEFTIPFDQGYWSVKGLLANRSYLAEIGVKCAENLFCPLLRSNTVLTPKLEMITNYPIYQDVFRLHIYEKGAELRTNK